MTSTQRRVLIVGGGIAGPVVAFWLAKAGFRVTLLERSRDPTKIGQGIDLRGPALEIVRRMGLESEVRSRTTHEQGFAFVDDDGKLIAALGTAAEGGTTLTQEIEIMRSELAAILAAAADAHENVTFKYGCTVTEIRQSERCVTVVLSDSDKAEDFEFVVGADGLRSKVRELVWDTQAKKDSYRPFEDNYCAYFSIPSHEDDFPYSRVQHARGGRSILIRPVNKEKSSAYLLFRRLSTELESTLRKPMEAQKAAVAEIFADFPGLGGRALQGMKDTMDFYFDRATQIKLSKWSNGRCVLVGDAAYSPSPLTGQGTTLAIVGSYVLAGELADCPLDPNAAFSGYEERLRDYVKEAQSVPLGGIVTKLVLPMTEWGIWVLRTVFWLFAWSDVWKWLDLAAPTKFKVPEYDSLR